MNKDEIISLSEGLRQLTEWGIKYHIVGIVNCHVNVYNRQDASGEKCFSFETQNRGTECRQIDILDAVKLALSSFAVCGNYWEQWSTDVWGSPVEMGENIKIVINFEFNDYYYESDHAKYISKSLQKIVKKINEDRKPLIRL